MVRIRWRFCASAVGVGSAAGSVGSLRATAGQGFAGGVTGDGLYSTPRPKALRTSDITCCLYDSADAVSPPRPSLMTMYFCSS